MVPASTRGHLQVWNLDAGHSPLRPSALFRISTSSCPHLAQTHSSSSLALGRHAAATVRARTANIPPHFGQVVAPGKEVCKSTDCLSSVRGRPLPETRAATVWKLNGALVYCAANGGQRAAVLDQEFQVGS